MSQLLNLEKIKEGPDAYKAYWASSLPCPKCGEAIRVRVSSTGVFNWHNGEHIQHVLPELSEDDRERFCSGYCPTHWDELFGDLD
jgi:hypothetical protein